MEKVEDLRKELQIPVVDLATRLRRITEILDQIVPEAEERHVEVQASLARTFAHIARHDIAQAISLLENMLRKDPLWLRGYLLLGTIYEEAQGAGQAIAVLESGINICRACLRSSAMQSCSLIKRGTFGHEVRSRLLRRAACLSRYERILRHRFAQVLVQAGRFEEALQYWTEFEPLHCA